MVWLQALLYSQSLSPSIAETNIESLYHIDKSWSVSRCIKWLNMYKYSKLLGFSKWLLVKFLVESRTKTAH